MYFSKKTQGRGSNIFHLHLQIHLGAEHETLEGNVQEMPLQGTLATFQKPARKCVY